MRIVCFFLSKERACTRFGFGSLPIGKTFVTLFQATGETEEVFSPMPIAVKEQRGKSTSEEGRKQRISAIGLSVVSTIFGSGIGLYCLVEV